MGLFGRCLRRAVIPLIGMSAGVCLGQTAGKPQYLQPVIVQGSLTAQEALTAGIPNDVTWPSAVYSADMNGDGYPDLIYLDANAVWSSSTIHVLLNDGAGGFVDQNPVSGTGNELAIGDFVGNGKMDLAWIATALCKHSPNSGVSVTEEQCNWPD